MTSGSLASAGPRSSASDKVVWHERVAQERHHWVRLTRGCNNRCQFCLDSTAGSTGVEPEHRVREQIAAGRQAGAVRLILSGGEPTLHPGYLGLIRYARQVGYREIQTVTNGRRFAYPGFLQACLAAGLSEITFSLHGHCAALHDELVGVPGAFEQAVSALRAALKDGRPIVNVDVCLSRKNIGHLPALLDAFVAMGVHEFDLLHLIPFGRAWESWEELHYGLDDAADSISYALELAQRPDLHIWFNRFPPQLLEGHERMIQDPHKLYDEVRGREAEFARLVRTGAPLHCRQRERCRYCHLQGLCEALDRTLTQLEERSFDVYRTELGRDSTRLPAATLGCPTLWLRASCAEQVLENRAELRALPGTELFVELDDYDGAEELGQVLGDKRWTRAYVSRGEDLDRVLRLPGELEVVAFLDCAMAAHLLERPGPPPPSLTLEYRGRARLTEAVATDPDLPAFFQRYSQEVRVENLPACIVGRLPRRRPRVLDASLLEPSGEVNLEAFTRQFVLEGFSLKRKACAGCVLDDVCDGAHVNLIRAHGFRWLDPVRRGRPA